MRSPATDHYALSILHSGSVSAFADGLADRFAAELDDADSEIRRVISEIIGVRSESISLVGARRRRVGALVAEILSLRRKAASAAFVAAKSELRRMVVHEVSHGARMLTESVGLSSYRAAVPSSRDATDDLGRVVFGGRSMDDHERILLDTDGARISGALWTSLEQGVRSASFASAVFAGALSEGARNYRMFAVSAAVHAASVGLSLVAEANAGVVGAAMWVSVLDGRTSLVCASRDGRVGPAYPGGVVHDDFASRPRLSPPLARPPAHPNCRSTVVLLMVGAGITGSRRYVTDTRTPDQRETDFVREAAEAGVDVSVYRARWERRHVGDIPAHVSFDEWLRSRPAEFQDSYLGVRAAREYRAGRLTLDDLARRRRRRYTFDELVDADEGSFGVVGL